MRQSLRIFCAGVFLLLLVMVLCPASSRAQCNTYTFRNNTGSTVTLCLWTTPPISCVTIPAGGTVTPTYAVSIWANGVISSSGAIYPWQTGAPPPHPYWLPSVQLATVPLPNQCYDVYWDQAACTATIVAAGTPPCIHP